MALREFLNDTARAVGFLSRIPIPAHVFEGYEGKLSRTVRAFAAAAVVIAAPGAAVLAIMLAAGAGPLLAAVCAVTTQVLTIGALHEDALGDAADGFGGGRDREHALEIMKDSRVGSYGAVALVLILGLRIAALSQLVTATSPLSAAACVIGVAALSRTLMVWHWSALPSARTQGVAAAAGMPEKQALQTALVSGALLTVLFILPATSPFTTIVTLATAALAAAAFTSLTRKKLRGHTGDTIGATQQVCEAAALIALAVSS
ncbi:adenosylcobinamide-GDP ribazoletransferase [Ciceribacter azotifigens]|uniref:adenosylcobinamide-GDP ribazoletransferase n=1 Tax=Ciceribacter azotifigens TaxID=2069303 RepID=UPI003A87F386